MGKKAFHRSLPGLLSKPIIPWLLCSVILGLTLSTHFIPNKTLAVSDDQSALLNEVKLLRQALERSQTTLPTFQIFLERTRFQSDLVNQHSQQLNDARGEMDRAHLEVEQSQRRIEDLKVRQRQSADPELQAVNEREIKELSLQIEQQQQRETLYRSYVEKLTAQISEEKDKLDEFDAQLNKLQAELIPQSQRSK